MVEPSIYPPSRRAWLDVDVGAVRRNAQTLARRAGVPLIPMVKADAYGLGARAVVAALEPLAPLAYGVATVAEGAALRADGVTRDIVVFTPLLTDELADAAHYALTPTLGSPDAIRAWRGFSAPYHLAVDTGMNRAGVSWRAVDALAPAVRDVPPAAAFTHFHSAECDDDSVREQERRFHDAVTRLGVPLPLLHTENSAAAVRNAGRGWGAIRPGIFLYGVPPCHGAVAPEAVVTMRARIVDIRELEPGDTVSYDATYTATGRERIATLAIGYADGYPRALSGRGLARVRGELVPVRGRVTMDMTMVDVTHVRAAVGDVVTLVDAASPLTVAAVADVAAMSPYELLTGLHNRLERRYTGTESPEQSGG